LALVRESPSEELAREWAYGSAVGFLVGLALTAAATVVLVGVR
jgi:hypothetical protein